MQSLPCLEMETGGRSWEGYVWVDGWPVSPLRHQPHQQQQAREPADGEMVVEPAEPVEPVVVEPVAAVNSSQQAVIHTDAVDNDSHSTTTNQVNDFLSSYTGSNCGSDEDSDEEAPDEKQVDLGNVYSQCRAAREAAFVSTVVDISCNENMLGTETKKWDRIGTLDKQLDPEIKKIVSRGRALKKME
jgi:hypothetical protein